MAIRAMIVNAIPLQRIFRSNMVGPPCGAVELTAVLMWLMLLLRFPLASACCLLLTRLQQVFRVVVALPRRMCPRQMLLMR
jgi:hypothetical protein